MKNLFKITSILLTIFLITGNNLMASDVHFIDYSKVMNESKAGKKAQNTL